MNPRHQTRRAKVKVAARPQFDVRWLVSLLGLGGLLLLMSGSGGFVS